MEDFAEYLVTQAQTENAALHEFILRFESGQDDFHLFFEGDEDPSFYMPFVREKITGSVSWSYICGGKRSLSSLRTYLVDNDYSLDRVLFFVDRDYDDLFGCQLDSEPRTFITEPYSIENYLVGAAQAEIVLVDLAGLSRVEKECEGFLTAMPGLLSRCADVTLPLIAVTLAAKEDGLRPNFNNINLARVFALSLEVSGIRRKEGALRICVGAILERGANVSMSKSIRWARRLRGMDPQLWFRGKYQLWFFEQLLLMFLKELSVSRKAAKKKTVRIPVSLREGRLFEALGGRVARIPALESFLETNLRVA